MSQITPWLIVATVLIGGSDGFSEEPKAAATESKSLDFNRDVLPILADRCFHCHGPDEKQRKADLRLDQLGRGESTVVVAGDLERSELIQRIVSKDPDERMPPADAARQLKPSEVELMREWVRQGARVKKHWSLNAPKRPALPQVKNVGWPRNEIDYFVLSRLEAKGWQPAAESDRETLIRRVTLDLTGIPPTLGEIDAFLGDRKPGAYERLVERLLSSPRYGEHMALPWLEASRYADTDGYQNDRLRYMWVWRDWVFRALNQDLSFRDFTIQQLAGDLLPQPTLHQQIATGFGRNHRINSEGGAIPAEWQVEYVVDRVDTLGTVWLGLTVGCARCHQHKYDPITQKDYYRLFAFFNNVDEWGLGPNNGNSPPFIDVPKDWPHVAGDAKAIVPAKFKLKTTQTSVVRPLPGGPKTVMVMQERKEPRPTYVLQRGLYDRPDKSEKLSAAVPPSLGQISAKNRNRLALAEWLVDGNNTLTARVTVNRYWQLFFGTGLVKTSDNFGVQGEPPSHPRLLDWLATEFVRGDWSPKAMHRLIVTSATYRQTSRVPRASFDRDPENRFLARASRFRLPGSTLRDAALSASGLLAERVGGPSVKPYMPADIWRSISNAKYVQDHGEKLYRRAIYTYWRRTIPPPTLMTFNAAAREVCTVRNGRTNTPLQALTLMNNVVFVESARVLAERALRQPLSDDDRLRWVFRLVTGRRLKGNEMSLLREANARYRAHFARDKKLATQLLKVGEYPHDSDLDPLQVATMAMTVSALFNLDETITRH